MAKQFTNLSKTYSQHINDFNILVNKVGDLSALNTSVDSDLVGAINAALSEGGVDSAAITSLLDSGQYLSFSNLTANSDSDIVITSGAQTIGGNKTFTGTAEFTSTPIISSNGDFVALQMRTLNRADSSEIFKISHDLQGTHFKWTDSAGGNPQTAISIFNQYGDASGDSAIVSKIEFWIDNTRAASIDSDNVLRASTIMTRARADTRYILDSATVGAANIIDGSIGTDELADSSITEAKLAHQSISTSQLGENAVTESKIANDAVTRAKLASEVQLIIYDSAGVAVKTLYGAGA